MEDHTLYKPKEMFDAHLKNQYHAAAEEYFEELVKKTETDAEGNKIHVKEYDEARAEFDAAKQDFSKTNGVKTMFLLFLILGFALGAIFLVLYFLTSYPIWALIVSLILLAGGGLSIYGFILFNKKAKGKQAKLDPLEKKTEERLSVCYKDLARLNGEFDWSMAASIMEKATPLIDLDPYFSNKTLEQLVMNFGLPAHEDEDTTVLGVLSGHIEGNPFILEKIRTCNVLPKTYTGSLVITWTEYVGSGKDRHAVTRSETLVASVTHDAAYYSDHTRLIYGNDSAPDLHFSRSPSNASKMDAKNREKAWKSGAKKLEKMSEKAAWKGGSFTKMSNDEFEVFFGAEDRDNETQFRLLFTPLAQTNMLEIIEDPDPYGDDFFMVKDGKLNSIASGHSQHFDYNASPSYFYDYSLEQAKDKFLAYCDGFIKGLYFDLAPLLSIPLYQMQKPVEYIYKDSIPGNFNAYEYEAMANGIDPSCYRPKNADPSLPLILKAVYGEKDGGADCADIYSYGFNTVPRVDYVSTYGGDGRCHEVPVHWIEYIPVESIGQLCLKQVRKSAKEYASKKEEVEKKGAASLYYPYFERGFLAYGSGVKRKMRASDINAQMKGIFGEEE